MSMSTALTFHEAVLYVLVIAVVVILAIREKWHQRRYELMWQELRDKERASVQRHLNLQYQVRQLRQRLKDEAAAAPVEAKTEDES